MAKKTVSSGGGGSHGKSVSIPADWFESAVKEFAGPVIPKGAKSIYDFAASNPSLTKNQWDRKCKNKVASGEWKSAKAIDPRTRKLTRFYWPSANK